MSLDLAESLRGRSVGVVGNCFELAPWADFLAANDKQWWWKHPQALEFRGRKFSANRIDGVEQAGKSRTCWNSGVLALQVAVNLGAEVIRLHGFDMQGTHYFGPYTNGLANTRPHRREVHKKQYQVWARLNRNVKVINCTPGSALDCFPRG
jgi:hypothetical protein